MARFIRTSSLLLLFLVAAPLSADDAADEAKAQAIRTTFQARAAHINELKQFDRPVSARELPRLVVRDGQLEAVASGINPVPAQRIQVIGSDAVWSVGSAAVGMGMGANVTGLEYLDASQLERDGICSAILSVRAGFLTITVRRGVKSNAEFFSISQRKNIFSLIVRSAGAPGAAVAGRMQSFSAESIEQFRQKSPAEYKQYVAPVIELLSLAALLKPGPTDVYRVFSEIKPAPESERQLLEIVAALASVDPAERTAASQRLEKLGTAGVLGALRLDRSILTPEQRNRVDAFLRSQSCFPNEPERLRHDPLFLVDCLESEDLRVRKLALNDLKAALNRDIAVDIAGDAESLRRAAAGLRKEISDRLEKASVQPVMTTHPAQPRMRVGLE
ncbi:MAG: hypothetical protein ACHRHE_03080 [Tepidisphaerales bacterium]